MTAAARRIRLYTKRPHPKRNFGQGQKVRICNFLTSIIQEVNQKCKRENGVLCLMIGTLIRNMATSKSKVTGIPIGQALDETFDPILKAVCYTSSSEVKIDLSREVKEG